MRLSLLLALLLLAACDARRGERFALPPSLSTSESVLAYLEAYVVAGDPLSDADRASLRRLFLEAARLSQERYNQDFPLNTKAPLYQLLRENFPAVAEKERERGAIIFLGDIADSLESSPPFPTSPSDN